MSQFNEADVRSLWRCARTHNSSIPDEALDAMRETLLVALAQNAPGDAPVDKRATGVYHKYNVTRTDGSDQLGGKHHDCEYFVLDLTHDPFAMPAATAYADACEAEYPMLAADMRNRYGLSAERARVPENEK